MQLADFFDRGVALHRARACLVEGEQSWTYGEVDDLVRRIAASLAEAGVGAGARAAVYSPNSAAAFACVLGIVRLGAVWVPVNARSTLDEVVQVLAASECEALFVHPAFAGAVDAIRTAVPTLRVVVGVDEVDAWASSTKPAPEAPGDPDGVAILGFTGGTTGLPKGVQLTHRNMETMTAAVLASVDFRSPPVYLAAAPLTHAAGALCYPVLAAGGTIVVLGAPDPDAILDAIPRHGVTFLFLPPTLVYMLLANPRVREVDLSTLEAFVYAAAPMAVEKLREAMEVFGPCMVQMFGQTEAPMICTVMTAVDHEEALRSGNEHRLGSCGRPSPFARIGIMADDGTLLPPGEVGEIVVRGNLVMAGYLDNPEATAEVSAHGWHHTGDVGRRDDDGFVYVVDRKKDMIITGGFNVFSAEVENVVLAHHAIQQCAVVGVPDDKWGESVTAVVELRPGATLDPDDLVAFCKERLGSVKAPKAVEVWEALPRSAVGKILKREVRDAFWQGRDRKV